MMNKPLPIVITSRPIFQLLIISIAVLVVFYPTIYAEICLVDDLDAFNWLVSSETGMSGLFQTLIPGGEHGGYYRPLIGISFYLDKILFTTSPTIMHLEGVLFHLLNAILVYLLTRECIGALGRTQSNVVPFVAGLLFGLHPITTESVNWISGRTDIMMGNFVLLSAFFLMRYKRTCDIRFLFFSLCAVFLGVLAKEAAFGYLVTAFFLYVAPTRNSYIESGTALSSVAGKPIIEFMFFYSVAYLVALFSGNFWIVIITACVYWVVTMYRHAGSDFLSMRGVLRTAGIALAVFTSSIFLFYLIRHVAFLSDAGKIGHTVRLMFTDLNYSLSLFIGAIGFYTQKFFFPWPLNFFILEIDPLYDFVGIAVLLVLLRLSVKKSLSTALWFVGVGLILPALPFAFGTIAWTGYAERYIYLSSAFWIVALAVQTTYLSTLKYSIHRFNMRSIIFVFSVLLIIVYSAKTWQRNVVWQKNVTLLKDTVDQSPKVKPLRVFYMAALFQNGQLEEAKKQYEIASTLYSRTYDPSLDLMMAKIFQKEKKTEKAYLMYENANVRSGFRSEPLLMAMISFLELFSNESSFGLSKSDIQQQISLYRLRLSNLHNKPASDFLNRKKGSHS